MDLSEEYRHVQEIDVASLQTTGFALVCYYYGNVAHLITSQLLIVVYFMSRLLAIPLVAGRTIVSQIASPSSPINGFL